MPFSFTEDELRRAVIKADRYELEALPADSEIDHEFSRDFEMKMRKLIRKSKKNSRVGEGIVWRKKIVILIATAMILFASTMSISAVRAPVIKLITEVYEKFTHIFFEKDQTSQRITDEFVVYEPTFIPKDFELFNRVINGHVLLEYEFANDYISYSQQYLEGISTHINTEGVELEELEFNGFNAMYYSNQGMQSLIWYNDTYIYTISSTLDRDTIFKIASSIKVGEN